MVTTRERRPARPPVTDPSKIGLRREAARSDGSPAYQGRRTEIARAAALVFKQRGFRGTTLSHVAEALGTDRASLYYYVSGKEELFQEVVADAMRVNLATAQRIREGPGTPAERLRTLLRAIMQSYAEFYPVLYLLIQENLNHVAAERGEWATEMRQINRDWEEALIGIIDDGQAEGTFSDVAPAWLVAYGITGMVGWTNRWFHPDESPVEATEIGEAFATIVLGGLEPRM